MLQKCGKYYKLVTLIILRGLKMKVVKIAAAIVSVLSLLFLLHPVNAAVDDYRWMNPTFQGQDSFYGSTYIYAYTVGSEATLVVRVRNHRSDKANVTVLVEMGWATENITSIEKNMTIQPGKTADFTVKIYVPSTASNLFRHKYKIFTVFFVGTSKYTYLDIESQNFVAFTSDQAEARRLRTELSYWPSGVSGYYWFPPSSKAWELWQKASVEQQIANKEYDGGNFNSAKKHYELALNYTKEALSTHVSGSTSFENAFLTLFTSGGNLMNFYGLAFFLGSIGFLLMGIGVIVYLIRKSKPQT